MVQLTEEQLFVVNITVGRHLVLAPPGTGKTQMLTERVMRALERGLKPKDMLCGTFTIRAAVEMRNRVMRECGKDDGELPLIGNLHHICNQLLFANRIVPKCTQVVDENFRAEALNEIKKHHPPPTFWLEDKYGKDSGQAGDIDTFRYNHDLTAAINLTLALRVGTPTEFLTIRKNSCVGETFVEAICDDYIALKKSLLVLDFDDLLIETYKALSSPKKLKKIHKYRWIQIDEVQDLNPLQWSIVDALAAPDAVFVFFGDYEQSIYSFLGASTKLLDRKAKDCELHFFETNFRSTSYLLDLLSRYSFTTLGSSFPFLPFPTTYETGAGHLRLLPNSDMLVVAREAKAMLELGETDNAAILVQTNQQADEAEMVVKMFGIPYLKVSGFEFNSRKIFRDLAALMEVVRNPFSRISWSRIIRHFARGRVRSQADAQRLVSEMFELRIDPRDLMDGALLQKRAKEFELYYERATKGRFVVFDTETTGLNVATDNIVQLTGVEYIDGKMGRQLNLFLKSPIPMPADAEAVHHISDAKLAEIGIEPEEGIRKFLDFVNGDLLIAHNLAYDKSMLMNACKRYGIQVDFNAIPMCDTLSLCRRLHQELTTYKLGALLEYFGLDGTNSHDALDDVLAAGNLFLMLAKDGRQIAERQREWMTAHTELIDALRNNAAEYFEQQQERLKGSFDLRGELRAFIDYSRDYEHPLYTASDCRRMVGEMYVGEADDWLEVTSISEGEEIATADLMRPLDKFFEYLETRYANDVRSFRQVIKEEWDEISKLKEADLISDAAPLVISTIHKAKGRQFDTVFIPYCQDSYSDRLTGRKVTGFPNFQVKFLGADRAENERLLYVGLSRAKRNLIVASDNSQISPYLDACRECFAPDFKDFYMRIRANGGELYDFGEFDWLARLYYLILCKKENREPPQFRKWFDDALPCIRKLAFGILTHSDNTALIEEVLVAALRSNSSSTFASGVALLKEHKMVKYLRDLRLKMLVLPIDAAVKGDIIGAFADCLPDKMAIEGLEDAVFDAYGPFRLDASRRLATIGRKEFAEVVNGTDDDWVPLSRLVSARERDVLEWRVQHNTPGARIISQVLRMSQGL